MHKFIFDFGAVVVRWSMDGLMGSIDREEQEKELVKQALFKNNDWHLMDKGTLTHHEVIANAAKRSGLPVSTIELYFYAARSYVIPVVEVSDLLSTIKAQGFELYGLSNMSESFYQQLKDYPVFKLFNGILWSFQDKLIKPDENIWLLLMERYNLKAQDCVFIDDLHDNIEVAKKLGFQTVHFTGIDKINEVKKYLPQAKSVV